MRFESAVRRRRMSRLFLTESQRSPWTEDAILKQVLISSGWYKWLHKTARVTERFLDYHHKSGVFSRRLTPNFFFLIVDSLLCSASYLSLSQTYRNFKR